MTNRRIIVRSSGLLLAGSALVGLASPVAAQVWDGSLDSDWTKPENWSSNAVPTAGTEVAINSTGGAPQPILAGAATSAAALTLAVGQVNTGSLTVRDGAVLNVGTEFFGFSLAVGGVASSAGSAVFSAGNGNGTLIITGEGSRVNAGSLFMGQGSNGVNRGATGLVEVLAGGTLALTNGAVIGSTAIAGAAGTGVLRVSGAGSTLRIQGGSNGARVNHSGSRVEILNGAQVTPTGALDWALNIPGALLIDGAGTNANLGNTIRVFSGSATFENAALVVQNGATARADRLSAAGSTALGPDSGSVIVRSGATFNTGLVELSFSTSRGALLVEDATLNVTGAISVGNGFGVSNSLLVLDNANVTAGSVNLVSSGSRIVIGAEAGQAPGGAGTLDIGSIAIAAGSSLLFNHTGPQLDLDANISGSGAILHRSGTTVLSGNASGYSGAFAIDQGSVFVNGLLGNASATLVADGGGDDFVLLGGSGTFGGSVTVGDATLAPGNSAGTLTIGRNLVLGESSMLQFELGAPNQAPGGGSDHISVGGNLTLDGGLSITDLGGFGSGLYRLITYAGTLTNNGLVIGTVPDNFAPSDLTLDFATNGQVNLLAAGGEPAFDFIFWDGANSQANGRIDGGSGTWTTTGTNWTVLDGENNGAFDPADFLIFRAPEATQTTTTASTQSVAAATPSAATGTVTVDNAAGQVSLANGVQFATTGYTVTGAAILLDASEVPCGECSPTPGSVIVRVGDGTSGGAGTVATISSALTGSSGLHKTDLGTLILLGANTYAGGTLVLGGTLQGNAASLQGSFGIAEQATLLFDQPGNGTFGGSFTGAGRLLKQGGGTLVLSGNSGEFAGLTSLEAGALTVSGHLGGQLDTSAGTVLSGAGRIGNLEVGGAIAPGTSIGTLTVDGELVFLAGSTYQVELAANGGTDLIVADAAIIRGGTVAISLLDPETAYTDGSVFVIVRGTDSFTGTFDGLTENSAFLDFRLGYDASSAFVTLDLVRQFPDVAQTFNQRQSSLGLVELGRTPGSDSLAVYNALLLLDEDDALSAFDLASGEIYADLVAAGTRAAMNRAGARLQGGIDRGREGWNAWVGGSLSDTRVKSDGNAARFDEDSETLELGIDYHGPGNGFAIGASGGWTASDIANDARRSLARLDGWFLSAFARYGNYGTGLTTAVAVSYADLQGDAARNVVAGPISRTALATVAVSSTGVAADARYGLGSGSFAAGPVAGIEYGSASLGDYAEAGAGALSLSGEGAKDQWARLGGGAFASYSGESVTAMVDVRYLFGDADNSFARHRLAGSPRSFDVRPALGEERAVRASATVEASLGEALSFGLRGTAVMAGNEQSLGGTASLRLRF